jgi:hypothetical protein
MIAFARLQALNSLRQNNKYLIVNGIKASSVVLPPLVETVRSSKHLPQM